MFRIRVLLSPNIVRVVRGFDVKISEEWSMVYKINVHVLELPFAIIIQVYCVS